MAGTSSSSGVVSGRLGVPAWLAGAAGIAAVFAVLVAATWVGFLESDDLEYANAASLWLQDFPHLAGSHWGLRHLIVLPIAASFALFGPGEASLVLPITLYTAAIVAMTGICVARIAGALAGLLAALLAASLPVLVTGASMVFSDTAEAFFVLASLWAYVFARRAGSGGLFVLSGVLAGCGFITRETTVALLAFYLVLFLLAPRRIIDFVRMAAGFLLVVGLDMLSLWVASGDPLWRFTVSQRGVAGDNPSLAQFQVNTFGLDRHGVIVAPRPLQALLAVFVNQSMGVLAWAAVPASLALALRAPRGAGRSAGGHFAGLALVWFLVLSYAFLFMWIVPRYQTVAMVALCVPLAIWLAGRIEAGARAVPILILLTVAGSGAALASVGDRELVFGERGLVTFARIAPGPIHTDPATLRGADWLLRQEGLRDKVVAGPCGAGDFCYVNPRPRRPLPAGWAVQAVPPDAAVLLEVPRRNSALSQALSRTGLLALMPSVVRARLDPAPMVAWGVRMPG